MPRSPAWASDVCRPIVRDVGTVPAPNLVPGVTRRGGPTIRLDAMGRGHDQVQPMAAGSTAPWLLGSRSGTIWDGRAADRFGGSREMPMGGSGGDAPTGGGWAACIV